MAVLSARRLRDQGSLDVRSQLPTELQTDEREREHKMTQGEMKDVIYQLLLSRRKIFAGLLLLCLGTTVSFGKRNIEL